MAPDQLPSHFRKALDAIDRGVFEPQSTFARDLDQARKDRIPVMALRPDHEHPDEMDDIVVNDVTMFRAEAMSDDVWWMCCYFANGERVTFHVQTSGPANRKQRLSVSVTEHPSEWTDLDAE